MKKTLKETIAKIEERYGSGSIMQLGQTDFPKVETISTGIISLDIALGGGIPRGRSTEIYGPEASGKTTLALCVIANAKTSAFIDAEHAFDIEWAKKLGVNTDNLLVSQPDTGEQALDIAESLIKSNAVDVIVVDSVASLVPAVEAQGNIGDTHIGLQARLMSQAMRKLTSIVHRNNTSLIFINQIRYKIGVMFGNPEITPGGNALKFHSSIRLDLRRIATLKNSAGEAYGNHIRARVVKNKIAPPFKTAEFDILFDSGVSYEGDLIDLGVKQDIIQKSGSWFNYGQIRLGQGKQNTVKFLTDNSELATEIETKIKEE